MEPIHDDLPCKADRDNLTIKQQISRKAKIVRKKLILAGCLLSDPLTPLLARLLLVLAIAYAVSPIDLIPDFIPVLGILDDLVLIPAILFLAWKLIPLELISEYNTKLIEDDRVLLNKWKSTGFVLVIGTWIIGLVIAYFFLVRHFV